MPIDQTIDVPRRRVVAKVRGRITLDEIVETIDAAVHDPAFEAGFDICSDHRGIDEIITTQQLKSMVVHLESIAARLEGARWAIITAEPASYGMMRMLSVHAQSVPMDVRVFKSDEEAEEWLESAKP